MNGSGYKNFVWWCFLFFCLSACEVFEPSAPADEDVLDGPVEGLTSYENLRFIRGDIAFNDDIFFPATGLGPLFVATSCGSCHPGDGKGHPFTTLTRFGQTDETGNKYLSRGGPQLQNRAIPGFQPETIPLEARSAKFTPPANTGLGFLDAVSDADILSRADPLDLDGDGISGVPNWIDLKNYVTARPESIPQNGKYIGRFGKKASAYNLLQQTAQAYNQDIGVTSTFEFVDTYTGLEADPEVSNQTIQDVVFYLQTLKAPMARQDNEAVEGQLIFEAIGCEKCHRREFQTGTFPIGSLSNKIFYPFTDLLLHDMGPTLDDGYTEGSAKTSEWRTPPLWGLGLSKNSQGGTYFLLHDGRARSIEDAIALHGGEGLKSKENFQSLAPDDKKKIIHFLESL
jgi:CxxC motif-containing protein (DUF1111 family)